MPVLWLAPVCSLQCFISMPRGPIEKQDGDVMGGRGHHFVVVTYPSRARPMDVFCLYSLLRR